MYYIGKRIDQFDAVFTQMLEYKGVEKISDIDCISRRNFGFSVDIRKREWFFPYISIKDAISYINAELGIGLKCKITKTIDELELCEKIMILGPLKEGVAVKGIRERYYNGRGYYILAKRIGTKNYIVFDPQGIPGLDIQKTEMKKIIESNRPYCIFGEGEEWRHKMPEKVYILQKGVMYHDNIEKSEIKEIENAVKCYKKGRENQISLQYGIINAFLQLDKVFLLARECEMLSEKAELDYYKYKECLYKAVLNEEVERIPEIWKRIWELLRI